MNINERLPDLTFQRPDGSAVRLSEFSERRLVLIFLRHLA